MDILRKRQGYHRKKTIAGKSYEFNTTVELIEGNNNPETGGPITSGYTVVKDDSWWKIAKKYNVNMLTLAKINNKTIFSIIHLGDVLQIPQD